MQDYITLFKGSAPEYSGQFGYRYYSPPPPRNRNDLIRIRILSFMSIRIVHHGSEIGDPTFSTLMFCPGGSRLLSEVQREERRVSSLGLCVGRYSHEILGETARSRNLLSAQAQFSKNSQQKNLFLTDSGPQVPVLFVDFKENPSHTFAFRKN